MLHELNELQCKSLCTHGNLLTTFCDKWVKVMDGDSLT